MEAKATAKFVRYTPRKVNQVLSLIRGKKVEKAFETLSFLPKSATTLVEKVLKSATANAGGLNSLSNFKIKEAWVGNGPILKRMRPGPQGRGMPVKKRTAHLTIVVTDLGVVESKKKKKVAVKTAEKKTATKKETTKRVATKKAETKTAETKKAEVKTAK